MVEVEYKDRLVLWTGFYYIATYRRCRDYDSQELYYAYSLKNCWIMALGFVYA
jgi:hypothetical protein